MSKPLSDLRVVITSSLVSVGDVVLNLVAGIFTGSTVMFAQALQGLSDLITSGLLLAGVSQSRKSSSKRYQFGYGREIFFWVLLAGLVMFIGTGSLSLYMGYRQFTQPGEIEHIYWALALLVINICTNSYAFSLSLRRLRQQHPRAKWAWRLRHSSVVETKTTFFVDMLGMSAGVLGLLALTIFFITGDARYDGLGSMAIGLSMMGASIYLIGDVRQFIVGRSADPEAIKKIRRAVMTVPDVQEILDLRTMYLGSGSLLIILEVHLQDGLDTDNIEQISDQIKQKADHAIPGKHHIQVEIETPDHELIDR